MTVAQLRKWIDRPNPMGLPLELQNLIILSFAALTNRRFILRGGPMEPTIDNLADELELREQALPEPSHWATAVTRAAGLFGLTVPQTLNAANVGRLVDDVRREAGVKRDAVGKLVPSIRDRATRYGASLEQRVRTSESAQGLLATLQAATDAELVAALATAHIETTEAAVSRSMANAQAVVDALGNARWNIFDAMRELQDHRQAAAASILSRLSEALGSEEHVIALKPKLEELERDAVRLLTVAAPAPVSAPSPAQAPLQPPSTGAAPLPPAQNATTTAAPYPETRILPSTPILVEEAQEVDLDSTAATSVLAGLQQRLYDEPDLELSLSWRIQRRGTQP
jgi:hypothetical protein